MNAKVVRLEIYTWQGTSIGAIHYYAELHSWDFNDKRGRSVGDLGRLERPLNAHDAAKINEQLRQTYSDKYYEMYKVQPGEMDYRFETREQALEEALKQWLVIFPDAEALVDYKDDTKVYATAQNERR